MTVGEEGKLWFEVGVWYVPSAQCETQLEMGVVRHLKLPIFSFEEVVTILTTEELHDTCCFIHRAKLRINGFACPCLHINKMSFFLVMFTCQVHFRRKKGYC